MNCLIDNQANITDTSGIPHCITATRMFGMSLLTWLKRGGIRIKIHKDAMAIEYRTMTIKQQIAINKILRDNDVYDLVTSDGKTENRIEKFRPIRKINLANIETRVYFK